jgi:hypothetical protein
MLKRMQKIKKNASALIAIQQFGLPEYSRHSFQSMSVVPMVKINSVPITIIKKWRLKKIR